MGKLPIIVAIVAFCLVGCMPHVDSATNSNPPVVVYTGDNVLLVVDRDGDRFIMFDDAVAACDLATETGETLDECIGDVEMAIQTGELKTGDCMDEGDGSQFINPDAHEDCDGVLDNNCNGTVDEGCDDSDCDDGNQCSVDTYALGTGCASTPVNCEDGNPCTTDSCDQAATAANKCVHANNTIPCNDGNPCTTSDACAAGSCAGGAVLICDDGKACTTDTCDPALGCTTSPNNTATCSDGNLCTEDDFCFAGECSGGSQKPCNDLNPCTTDSCDSATGCKNVAVTDGTCCWGNTGPYGDLFCVATTKPTILPPGYIWGCKEGATAANPGRCTSCLENDGDGFCATGENCVNGWDDDGDAAVDCDDSECAAHAACTECSTHADCDDANPGTVDTCTPTGNCTHTPACVPDCNGKQCGDDGCGGSCGTCGAGQTCTTGQCMTPPTPPECVSDADCAATGGKCWNGDCVVVSPGSCGPFSISVIAPSGDMVDLEWYGPTGSASTVQSVGTGTHVSHTGECSVVAWGFAPNGCSCDTLYGVSPCGEQPKSPGVMGCWHNKVGQ